MPFYKKLDGKVDPGKRTIEGILRLRGAMSDIPAKTLDQTLLLASWNLREFGGTKYGGRQEEAIFYIAEIISRFDIVAVQEVRDNLDALDALMRILGGWWDYLVSDVTLGRSGNQERHAFIFDKRKLSFGGLAGEIVPEAIKRADGTLDADFTFSRTPYLAGFQAGWFKFTICTQHMYYGQSKPDDPQRVKEAEAVARLLKIRMKSRDRWANNTILLGDFNVFNLKDRNFAVLIEEGFTIPAGIKGAYTNAKRDKPFDQMAFLAPDIAHQVEIANCGVFPFFESVYRETDANTYQPGSSLSKFKEWRTYQMSDHLPLWIELKVDFGKEYLEKKLK